MLREPAEHQIQSSHSRIYYYFPKETPKDESSLANPTFPTSSPPTHVTSPSAPAYLRGQSLRNPASPPLDYPPSEPPGGDFPHFRDFSSCSVHFGSHRLGVWRVQSTLSTIPTIWVPSNLSFRPFSKLSCIHIITLHCCDSPTNHLSLQPPKGMFHIFRTVATYGLAGSRDWLSMVSSVP